MQHFLAGQVLMAMFDDAHKLEMYRFFGCIQCCGGTTMGLRIYTGVRQDDHLMDSIKNINNRAIYTITVKSFYWFHFLFIN
jgi:hypothetical protein